MGNLGLGKPRPLLTLVKTQFAVPPVNTKACNNILKDTTCSGKVLLKGMQYFLFLFLKYWVKLVGFPVKGDGHRIGGNSGCSHHLPVPLIFSICTQIENRGYLKPTVGEKLLYMLCKNEQR
jgi:hypothetical protein